jgi:hypothetical protein
VALFFKPWFFKLLKLKFHHYFIFAVRSLFFAFHIHLFFFFSYHQFNELQFFLMNYYFYFYFIPVHVMEFSHYR